MRWRSGALRLAVLLAAGSTVQAQDSGIQPIEKEKPQKPKKALKISTGGGLEILYDDNVFHLNGKNRNTVENDPGTNNKFSRMDSADDFILHGYGRVDLDWAGIAGKAAFFRFETGGYGYIHNELRSHSELKLAFKHEIWKGGDAYIKTAYIPREFRKNAFVGGVDFNGNFNISRDERIYKHRIFNDLDVRLGVESRIAGPFSGELYGGWERTNYDEPFDNWDTSAGYVVLKLQGDFTTWFTLGVMGKFEIANSPDDPENVLIDETVFGEQDGNAGLDAHAQISTQVDRSYDAFEFGPDIKIVLMKDVTFRSFWTYRIKNYGSSHALDVTYNDRTDKRQQAGAEVQFDLSKKVKWWLGYTWTRQTTDRPNDPDNISDDLDYRENEVAIGVQVYY